MSTQKSDRTDSMIFIGCCGTYCKTCKPFASGACKGCKLGYANGERDISKAKCAIKVCCIGKELETCGDCVDIDACKTINSFYGKNGYKYKRYKQSMGFIRTKGYRAFIDLAEKWNGPYGKLE